ncbi:MAG TPA: sigma 54-interacting transcriptional regulator [Syntrophomonadaceae bacterium]|nr:sigma 54-interacting transcriptional regulator [Syntrophomonadaceae bacterium]HPR92864.1 sigma 54-interacting transcriptional regulator [Syntrophomonadaceae bacterium]
MKIDADILKKIFALVPHALLLLNAEELISVFNEGAQKLFDFPADALDEKLSAYTENKNLLKFVKTARKNSRKAVNIKDKRYNCYVVPVNSDNFKGKAVLFIEATEIDAIKQELAEARALKEELDEVIENSYDYIFVTDSEGNVKKINDAYTRITGFKPEEIMGSNIYELVAKGYFDRAATIDVIETKKTQTFTQTLKSGKTVLVTGNPIFSENEEFIGVVTNGRDITDLNRLKREVTKAEGLSQHYQKELMKFQLDSMGDYIIASQQMADISDLVKRIARVDSTVLINGESGVGKEIVAREIHRNSMRSNRPYISVNCAAIPDNLLESELFGYEGGAFTGANKHGKMGIFQLADGGTLFLDEIGELPFYLQAKLLRVIQENEVMRIGGAAPIPIDVRLVTATNRDLWKMVNERQFREDLYYRLNVVQVRIPPLRERKEEIPVFVDYFLGLLNKKYNLERHIDPELIEGLVAYDWPGNIRELRNTLEQAFVTSPGTFIADIKIGPQQEVHLTGAKTNGGDNAQLNLKDALQRTESRIIKEAMDKHGTTRKAAAALGVSQATIWRKAKQYGIHVEEE